MEEISAVPGSSANGSSSSSSNNNNNFEIVEVITDSVEESRGRRDGHSERRIEKVPLLLRNDRRNKGYYDPKVVSIGPYHHGNPKLQITEKIKPEVAQLFVATCEKWDMGEFRQKVGEKVDIARSYYVDGSTDNYSDKEFTEMMFLDACFILALLEETVNQDNPTILNNCTIRLGMQERDALSIDMFYLLENQLPLLVLETMMAFKYDGHDIWMDKLDSFVGMLSFGEKDQNKNAKAGEICKKHQPLHLLEFFWLRERELINRSNNTRKCRRNRPKNMNKFIHSFRSVTELKGKGIHVRPSSSGSRKVIEFKSFFFFGLLKLPPFFFAPETVIRCSNLIAYELCLNDPKKLPTMAYLHFMKSIINYPDDVKELRYKAVLFTTFSSDQKVVENFKSIVTYGGDDFNIYEEVEAKIQKYYHGKPKAWIVDLLKNYFHFCSSPWTFIGFLAGTSLVVFAFLQTYFTMNRGQDR